MVTLLVAGLTGLHAQQAIPAAGGNGSGSGGTVSFTAGQVAYTTISGSNGSAMQGVQLPYEILVVTGIEPANGISLQCVVYPNPTTDFLTLRVGNYDLSNLSFQLFDANGKILETKKISDNETIIRLEIFPIAFYFLNVMDNGIQIKSFKIIKK